MKRLVLLWLLLALLLAGCSSMEVQVDYDPNTKFAGLETYDWIPEPRERTGDPRIDRNTILEKRIKTAVERELDAKGLRKSSESPDFWLAYHVTLDKKQSVTTLNKHYNYSPAWGWAHGYERRPRGYMGASETFILEYEQGTLLLDVVDPEGRDLLWRGSARDEVNFSAKPAEKEEQINEAVRQMLANFPPK